MSKLALKKLIRQLDKIKGRHTELVTVYIPANSSLNEAITQLKSEESTAENIKSKSVRKNVTTALDKIIRHLQLYKKTPENGLVIFCGNISEKEGSSDIEIWAVEPPEPVKTKMYWCDQKFVLEPLKEMVEEREVYGIICLDKTEADIALVTGKKIEPIVHFDSIVPGKTRAGGQCFVKSTKIRCIEKSEIVEIPIEKVKEGNSVVCYDTKNRKNTVGFVTKKFKKNARNIYSIVTDLTKIRTTAEHVFFVSNKTYFKEKNASDLVEGEFLLANDDGSVKETKILSIRKIPKNFSVFDLSVKKYENFIANNLLVHNSSARFSRVREGLLQDWYKKVAEAANKIFNEHPEVLGIIISGSGPIKEFFLKEELLHDNVAKKILGVVDTSYTGEYGLHETLEKSGDLLKEASVMKEKKILQRFFQELQKPHGLAIYGLDKTIEMLERGSVDYVIITEDLNLRIGDKDAYEYFEEQVENYGSKLIVVSADTREGQQFKELGGIGGMLRYV